MILFLKKILVFAFLTAFLYVIGLNFLYELLPPVYRPNILYQSKYGLLDKKIEESKSLKDIDVLFIGSSHSYNSFDPRKFEQFGIQSYNWGTNQQTHIQTEMVLKEYLKSLQPKLVVYEVFPEMFAMEGRESMTDFINSGEPFELEFEEIFKYDNSIIFINTYLIKYTRELLGFKTKLEKEIPLEGYYKGYVPNTGENKYTDSTSIKWIPRKEQINAFEKNLNFLNSQNIDYLLVMSPFPFSYENPEEYLKYLKSKGDLLDYNNILEFDTERDFSDFHHINENGVKKMNEHLAPLLEKEIKAINGQKIFKEN